MNFLKQKKYEKRLRICQGVEERKRGRVKLTNERVLYRPGRSSVSFKQIKAKVWDPSGGKRSLRGC